MPAIIFALISYFSWGTGVFFEAIVARKLNSFSLVIWGYIITTLLLSFYAPFATGDLKNLTWELLILIFSLSFVGISFGTLFYYEALKIANRALVGAIASSFPAVTVILSVLFLNEKISGQQGAAIALIFLGLFLSVFNLTKVKNKSLMNKGILFALLTMFTWGLYFTFIKIPVKEIGWFWPNYMTFLIFPVFYLYQRLRKIKLEAPTKNNALIPLIVATVLVRMAELSYNLGISKGLVTVVAPIAGANPTLFVVLAFLIFKDPITRQQIAGIITTLIGIVLLSVFSV